MKILFSFTICHRSSRSFIANDESFAVVLFSSSHDAAVKALLQCYEDLFDVSNLIFIRFLIKCAALIYVNATYVDALNIHKMKAARWVGWYMYNVHFVQWCMESSCIIIWYDMEEHAIPKAKTFL